MLSLLLNHLGNPRIAQDDETLVINAAVLNDDDTIVPTDTLNTTPTSIPLLSKADGVWAHFWDRKLQASPRDFRFPSRQALYGLWMNWHIPNISKKVCPYTVLRAKDVGHITRGQTKLGEIRMVIQEMIDKLKENDDLYDIYKPGNKHVHTLSDIYDKVKCIFYDLMTEKKKARFAQLS